MSIKREKLYRFPWSKTDNPGGWVEVTDECDLTCRGCYRHRLEGHRSLEDVKEDIVTCQRLTNCDSMAIAGGEPLLYPHIVEVVDFMSHLKIKPVILTNGEKLTWQLGQELKKAGLAKFHFHVDSAQERPGWQGKDEVEMNKLRQHFADFVWQLGGIQCGYNVTIYRSTLKYLPEIVEWCRANIHKVQHISLIAFRAIPLVEDIDYMVNGQRIDPRVLQNSLAFLEEINITTEEMFEILQEHFSYFQPCAYLGGTTSPTSHKYLIIAHIGSKQKIYGVLGAKTIELVQVFYHLFKGRYCAFLKNPKAGKKILFLSLYDSEIKSALINFLKAASRNPLRLLDKIYTQSIHLQQPNEILNGEVNLCDGCANMMIYKGKLINSCRLDEYRMFGSLITPHRHKNSAREEPLKLKEAPE
jgi:uncharacterized Fe-S cluster-containing radical SAM superfamily protein